MLKFSDKVICLDLNSSTKYKEKKNLVDLLTSNGANVTFVLNKRVLLLVKNDKNVESYKCRTAFRLSIPIVTVDFIYHCLNNEYVNLKEYLILDKNDEENFKKGKISKSSIL
jgi:poly [ADP-ribose] polymerase